MSTASQNREVSMNTFTNNLRFLIIMSQFVTMIANVCSVHHPVCVSPLYTQAMVDLVVWIFYLSLA